jgi:hypothetical protein
MANFFYATAEERHDVVAVAFFQPGEELLHFYNYDAIRSEEPDGDDFHDYAGALPDLEITENVAASAPGLQTLPVSPVVPSVATIEIEPVSESEGTAPRARDILPTCTAVAPMTVEEQNLLLHGDKTQKITSGVLKAFVRSIHLITPSIVESSFRLVNTSNGFSQEHLQIRCLDQAGRMKYARENKIKTQMSARESVEAFMRMLTIFATEHSSRQYYCEMRQVATQTMLDEHQTGIDSVFWINMHIARRSSLSQIAHRSSLIAQRTQHIAHRLLSSYIAYRKAHIAHCTSHIAYRISHIAHRTSLIAHGASHITHLSSLITPSTASKKTKNPFEVLSAAIGSEITGKDERKELDQQPEAQVAVHGRQKNEENAVWESPCFLEQKKRHFVHQKTGQEKAHLSKLLLRSNKREEHSRTEDSRQVQTRWEMSGTGENRSFRPREQLSNRKNIQPKWAGR